MINFYFFGMIFFFFCDASEQEKEEPTKVRGSRNIRVCNVTVYRISLYCLHEKKIMPNIKKSFPRLISICFFYSYLKPRRTTPTFHPFEK